MIGACQGKPSEGIKFFVSVSRDLIQKGLKAGVLVNKIAEVCGGRGGGRDDFAQAGGKDISKVKEALALGKELVDIYYYSI